MRRCAGDRSSLEEATELSQGEGEQSDADHERREACRDAARRSNLSVRVVVDVGPTDETVVTVDRTSKIDKYWSET
jgi:hypothetical protein